MIGHGCLLMAGLSFREALRTGLPILTIVSMIAAVAVAAQAEAVDELARRQLAMSSSAMIALVAAAFTGPLTIAIQMRRDLDHRAAFMLFSRPLDRTGYVLGRWLGAVLSAGATGLCAALAGGVCVQVVHGNLEQERPIAASSWSAISPGGTVRELLPVNNHALSGPAGGAVRWQFSQANAGQIIAVRVRVASEFGKEGTLIRAYAVNDGQRIPLLVSVDSATLPTNEPHETMAQSRGPEHRDLRADRSRFRLPNPAISSNGDLVVEIHRASNGPAFTCDIASCEVLAPGGSAIGALVRASLAGLAAAAAATAFAAWLVPSGGVGVALLGALTLLLAGSLVGPLESAISDRGLALPLRRFLTALVWVAPDLGRSGQGEELAAGRAIPLTAMLGAWLAIIPITLAMLTGAVWTWARREL